MMPLTKRQAKLKALQMAWAALHSMSVSWPENPTGDDDYTPEDHDKLSKELDELAQSMFNRAERMKERSCMNAPLRTK